mgnify:CR=1 FL=1|tara:strand:+ start:63 stop:1004 length:942 start_codon:yes stop_codon:yes gene_type:complete
MKDFYKILEVNNNATQDEIKKSYRKLSLIHHPDKSKDGNSSKFQEISEAYETLGDIDKKKEYDVSRNNPFIGRTNMSGGMSNGMPPGMQPGMNDMNDIFKMFFGNQMPHGIHSMGDENPINIRMFRNGHPINTDALNKPTPIIKTLVISLEQAYNGDNVPITIERWLFEHDIRKIETETLYIQLMKGIDDKEIIILREKGNVLKNDLKGDVKIIINIQNSSIFKRTGLNLYIEKEISLKESLCGFEFIINHISGKQLRYNNEPGNPMKDGLIKSISGYGMERENNKGDLHIKFIVKYPEILTSDQIDGIKNIL